MRRKKRKIQLEYVDAKNKQETFSFNQVNVVNAHYYYRQMQNKSEKEPKIYIYVFLYC